METRIKYIKKEKNGWCYAIQVKKWLFWKTIETYATFEGAERFLNILKDIDEFNGKTKSLNKIVYDGWAVRNVRENTGPAFLISFFNSSVHKREYDNYGHKRIWADCNDNTWPIMEIKAKKLFGKECLEPMKLRITIEQIEEQDRHRFILKLAIDATGLNIYQDMNNFLCMSITNRLKEKGFTFELPITYDGNGTYYHSIEPRISQVLDWLRTEKDIDIVIYPVDASTVFMGGEKYILSVYNCGKREYKIHSNKIDCYVKWEDAAVAGIEYVLDNLI